MTTSADSSDRSTLASLPRNVWVVTATSFLTDVSSEMIFNVLPLFLLNVLGVKTSVIGLIEGVAETVASLLKIFSGWLSDKMGSRKWLTVLGYGISAVSKPFLMIAASWEAVLAVRASDRVGKGIRTAPRDALIADTIDEKHRGLAFGLHRAGDTAGAMVGLLIALGVVWLTEQNAAVLTGETFRLLVLIATVPGILAVIVLALGARDVRVKNPDAKPPRLSLMALGPNLRHFLLVVVLFTLGNSADAFIILRAQERGLSVVGVLAMLATFNLIYASLATPLGALSDRIGRRRIILGGWTVYGILYLGFALAQAAWHIWVLYALYGIYYAAFEGAAKAFVADLADPSERGSAYGMYNAAVGIAALPSSVIAGVLWQGLGAWPGFGPTAPFLFGASMALLAAVLLLILVRQVRQV